MVLFCCSDLLCSFLSAFHSSPEPIQGVCVRAIYRCFSYCISYPRTSARLAPNLDAVRLWQCWMSCARIEVMSLYIAWARVGRMTVREKFIGGTTATSSGSVWNNEQYHVCLLACCLCVCMRSFFFLTKYIQHSFHKRVSVLHVNRPSNALKNNNNNSDDLILSKQNTIPCWKKKIAAADLTKIQI